MSKQECYMSVKTTKSALQIIEDGCGELQERVEAVANGRTLMSDQLRAPMQAIAQARNFAWAMRTFPIFDPNALKRLREFTFEKMAFEGDHGEPFSGKLFLPHFAWAYWRSVLTDRFSSDRYTSIRFGTIEVAFDYETLRRNGDRLGGRRFAVMAYAPIVPNSVIARVTPIADRFTNVQLVWEAEWQPAPVGDPLVIGMIFDTCFLLDQFDVTKLERYVVSEFCTKSRHEAE